MNNQTSVIVDNGTCFFDSYPVTFFCSENITEENVVNAISQRAKAECVSNGFDAETNTLYVKVSF
jgi:hypothetical protein